MSHSLLFLSSCLISFLADAQMIGAWEDGSRLEGRQNNRPDTSAFNIAKGLSTLYAHDFEWPECLVGDGQDTQGTQRGEYNMSIHQNYRLNGAERYSIFNLPISVTNNINRFPGAGQLSANPIPGPLSANGGRVSCASIENPMMDFATLLQSVNNPPGQPMQDIAIETSGRSDGGQVGGPGQDGEHGDNGGDGGSRNDSGNRGSGGDFGETVNGNRNGQGQISPNRNVGQAIGGASEVLGVSVWALIVPSTTAVLFTAAVF